MNAKILMFVIFVEGIIYLLLYDLHDCTLKKKTKKKKKKTALFTLLLRNIVEQSS